MSQNERQQKPYKHTAEKKRAKNPGARPSTLKRCRNCKASMTGRIPYPNEERFHPASFGPSGRPGAAKNTWFELPRHCLTSRWSYQKEGGGFLRADPTTPPSSSSPTEQTQSWRVVQATAHVARNYPKGINLSPEKEGGVAPITMQRTPMNGIVQGPHTDPSFTQKNRPPFDHHVVGTKEPSRRRGKKTLAFHMRRSAQAK